MSAFAIESDNMNKKTLVMISILIAAVAVAGIIMLAFRQGTGPSANAPAPSVNEGANSGLPPLGSDRDEHGCIGSAGYSWCPLTDKCQRPWEEPCSISADFKCLGKKSIAAEFDRAPVDQVKLKLSDGRELTLPHAVSADGARYANAEESIVFWNKGEAAFITENGKETYSCVTK